MEILTLLLHLRLSDPKASLSAPPIPVPSSQLKSKLLIPTLSGGEGFSCLCVDVIHESSLVSGIFHSFLGHENLLYCLHKNDKETPYQI